MFNRLLLAGVLLAVMAATVLADTAFTVKETIVRIAPDNRSEQLAVLPVAEKVDLQTRQGGWYQIRFHDDQSGWLPLLSVRKKATTPQQAKSSGLRSLLSSYRTGSSDVTVATGVRGLDAVDLKNSKPDLDELKLIDNYICSADEARAYAVRSELISRDLAWLKIADSEERTE